MTLHEKMAAVMTADGDHIYEAVSKLTDAQKDIAIATLVKVLRGEKPKGWDEAMNATIEDVKRMVENDEIAD